MKEKKIVICVGSGPSLCDEDIDMLAGFGGTIITANRAYHSLKNRGIHTSIAYSADQKWWKEYYNTVDLETIKFSLYDVAERLRNRHKMDIYGYKYTKEQKLNFDKEIYHGGNSGQHCVDIARMMIPDKIVLLGFDFQHTGGKKHNHADYTKPGWVNALNCERWVEEFKFVANYTKFYYNIDLVNCSRETAIESCRRGDLRTELEL